MNPFCHGKLKSTLFQKMTEDEIKIEMKEELKKEIDIVNEKNESLKIKNKNLKLENENLKLETKKLKIENNDLINTLIGDNL
jgi:hypothetical protein